MEVPLAPPPVPCREERDGPSLPCGPALFGLAPLDKMQLVALVHCEIRPRELLVLNEEKLSIDLTTAYITLHDSVRPFYIKIVIPILF